MKKLWKYWPILTTVLGITLIAAGSYAAYWWYYRSAPYRKMYDPNWCRQHSALAYWEAFRSCYDRRDWPHEAFSIGIPGDKDFMATLISRIQPGDGISDCYSGHVAQLFPYITNQDVGDEADAWLAWWKTNQSKSQVDWIREGFAARGIPVTTQLQSEIIVPLLNLMGSTDTNKATRISPFLKYNAFRWLRDSSFDPMLYAVSNLTAATEAQTKEGLIAYAKWDRIYPRHNAVGILSLGQGKEPWAGWSRPMMLEPWFFVAICSVIYGTPMLGVALLFVSLRKNRRPLNQQIQTISGKLGSV